MIEIIYLQMLIQITDNQNYKERKLEFRSF